MALPLWVCRLSAFSHHNLNILKEQEIHTIHETLFRYIDGNDQNNNLKTNMFLTCKASGCISYHHTFCDLKLKRMDTRSACAVNRSYIFSEKNICWLNWLLSQQPKAVNLNYESSSQIFYFLILSLSVVLSHILHPWSAEEGDRLYES